MPRLGVPQREALCQLPPAPLPQLQEGLSFGWVVTRILCKPRTSNSAVYDGSLLGFWPPLGSSSVSLSRFVSKPLPCQQHPQSFSSCQAHRQDVDLEGLGKALRPLDTPRRLGGCNKPLLYEAPRTGGQWSTQKKEVQ